MGAPVRYSRQREAILEFLKTRKDHPTAESVYQHLRLQMPNISLGTVYRNLNQLSMAGTILKLNCDGKTDHFDPCTDPHSHFLCKQCGSVLDIEFDNIDDLLTDVQCQTNHSVESVNILFTGTCALCKSK